MQSLPHAHELPRFTTMPRNQGELFAPAALPRQLPLLKSGPEDEIPPPNHRH